MTGIQKLDDILEEMRDGVIAQTWYERTMDEFAGRIENAVNEFLASKQSYYCTNTECPLKKSLSEEEFDLRA